MQDKSISVFHPTKCAQLSSVASVYTVYMDVQEMAFTKKQSDISVFLKIREFFLNSVLWETLTFSVSAMGVPLFLTCLPLGQGGHDIVHHEPNTAFIAQKLTKKQQQLSNPQHLVP